jgi:phosphoribosylformylglycinamidine synthase subunit PurL
LAVALAEMALAGGVGASVELPASLPEHGFLFGEDQARYILTAGPESAGAIMSRAQRTGVACEIVGTTGGEALTLGTGTAILLDDLMEANEAWLPQYMAG